MKTEGMAKGGASKSAIDTEVAKLNQLREAWVDEMKDLMKKSLARTGYKNNAQVLSGGLASRTTIEDLAGVPETLWDPRHS